MQTNWLDQEALWREREQQVQDACCQAYLRRLAAMPSVSWRERLARLLIAVALRLAPAVGDQVKASPAPVTPRPT